MNILRFVLRVLLGLFFIGAGWNHFRSPEMYLQMMPPFLPAHLPLIYISGVAEMVGGVAVLIPRLQIFGGWGLILLLIAVFPANIYAIQHGMSLSHGAVPLWVLWIRLPFQLVFIYWVYWCCLAAKAQRHSPAEARRRRD